jgi:hypothetical protein
MERIFNDSCFIALKLTRCRISCSAKDNAGSTVCLRIRIYYRTLQAFELAYVTHTAGIRNLNTVMQFGLQYPLKRVEKIQPGKLEIQSTDICISSQMPSLLCFTAGGVGSTSPKVRTKSRYDSHYQIVSLVNSTCLVNQKALQNITSHYERCHLRTITGYINEKGKCGSVHETIFVHHNDIRFSSVSGFVRSRTCDVAVYHNSTPPPSK